MDRLERLLNLLSALIDTTRPLSRDELRERVPGYSKDDAAFRRAFERDKETLRSMGMAIQTGPLDAEFPDYGEGYRIPPEDYSLPDPGLTREEMDALALAASSVKLKSDAANSALGKLGGDARTGSGLNVELNDDERLTQLFSARSERRTVTFDYKDKIRILDPYRLSFRNGHWYVNGFDHGYEDVRTYRLDRIESKLTIDPPDSFEAPAPSVQPWLPPWQMGDELPMVVHLLVDSTQAAFATEQSGSDTVLETLEDGSVVLKLSVTNRNGLRSFVLGFLDHAEILSPPVARDDMIDYLKSMVTA